MTRSAFSLLDCEVTVKVGSVTNPATNAYVHMTAVVDGLAIEFIKVGPELKAQQNTGAGMTPIAAVTYQPFMHVYWRLRESAGFTFWETSPDGVRWPVLMAAPDPLPFGSVQLMLGSGAFDDHGVPVGEGHFDDVNVLPPPTP